MLIVLNIRLEHPTSNHTWAGFVKTKLTQARIFGENATQREQALKTLSKTNCMQAIVDKKCSRNTFKKNTCHHRRYKLICPLSNVEKEIVFLIFLHMGADRKVSRTSHSRQSKHGKSKNRPQKTKENCKNTKKPLEKVSPYTTRGPLVSSAFGTVLAAFAAKSPCFSHSSRDSIVGPPRDVSLGSVEWPFLYTQEH